MVKKKLRDWALLKRIRGTTEMRLRAAMWSMGYDMISVGDSRVVVREYVLYDKEDNHE